MTIASLKELSKKGVKLFLCSARPFHSMDAFGTFSLGISFDGYVSSAGAVCKVGEKCIRKTLMKKEDVIAFSSQCLKDHLTMEYVETEERKLLAPSNAYSDIFYSSYNEVRPLVNKPNYNEVVGINFFAPSSYDVKYQSLFPSLLYRRYFTEAVDVMGEPHEKGDGVKAILNYLGLKKEDVLGFGDDIQDISMAEALPHFVCMGQGKDELKKISEYVTSPVYEDGFYKALVHYGLVKKLKIDN